MSSCCKVIFILMSLTWNLGMTEAETIKRDVAHHQPGLEFLQLGNFGPVSGLAGHPTFAPLGLTPQQTLGFVTALLRGGLLAPHALRLPGGHPLPPPAPLCFPGYMIDPYFLFLATHHERYLPFGLGPQGFFGSTGLPKPRPLGVFKYNDKN